MQQCRALSDSFIGLCVSHVCIKCRIDARSSWLQRKGKGEMEVAFEIGFPARLARQGAVVVVVVARFSTWSEGFGGDGAFIGRCFFGDDVAMVPRVVCVRVGGW
jgi:hypothetical protein